MRKVFTTAFLTIALGASSWAQAPAGFTSGSSPSRCGHRTEIRPNCRRGNTCFMTHILANMLSITLLRAPMHRQHSRRHFALEPIRLLIQK